MFVEQQHGPDSPASSTSDSILTIPAGSFFFGTDVAELPALVELCERDEPTCGEWMFADETEAELRELPSFRIDRTEVSNAAYGRCVAAGDCPVHRPTDCVDVGGIGRARFVTEERFADFSEPTQPVVCVTAYEAMGYCAWVGGRLPSTVEWEKAARGTDGRRFPWGEEPPTCDDANFRARGFGRGCGLDRTSPVDSHAEAASPYGALNMAGNVDEWVTPAYLTGMEEGFEIRGGGWDSREVSIRTAARHALDGDSRWIDLGFRCAYD